MGGASAGVGSFMWPPPVPGLPHSLVAALRASVPKEPVEGCVTFYGPIPEVTGCHSSPTMLMEASTEVLLGETGGRGQAQTHFSWGVMASLVMRRARGMAHNVWLSLQSIVRSFWSLGETAVNRSADK